MTVTIYEFAIPPMIARLQNLSKIMDKAVAQAKEKDIALAKPDRGTARARHASPHLPDPDRERHRQGLRRAAGRHRRRRAMADTETTFPELQERIAKTIAFLESVKPEQLPARRIARWC